MGLPNTSIVYQGCYNKGSNESLFASCKIYTRGTFGIGRSLDLSYVEERFVLPKSLYLLPDLYFIIIAYNPNMTGTIPTEYGRLSVTSSFAIMVCPKLSGTIPTELAMISTLNAITIRDTGVSGTIPTQFESYSKIRFLTMYNNQLEGLMPTRIGVLNLVDDLLIDVSGNRLSGTLPSFSELKNLRTLIVAGNNFTGGLPDFPLRLSNLYAGYNRLTGTLPTQMALHRWDTLILNNNQFTGTIPPNLYIGGIFAAESNDLSGLIPPFAATKDKNGAINMIQFLMNNNQFTGFHPDFFTRSLFIRLRHISLESNRLSDLSDIMRLLGENSSANFPGFVQFSGKNNNVSGSFPPGFRLNPALADIDLSSNKLDGTIEFQLHCGRSFSCYDTYLDKSDLQRHLQFESNRLDSSRLKYASLTSFENPDDPFSPANYLQPSASTLFFDLGTQDFDECATNASDCQHICLDGWHPQFSYTCSCYDGYFLAGDLKSCQSLSTLTTTQIAGMIAGLVVFFLLTVASIIGFFVWYYYLRSNLFLLPPEISWSFLDRLRRPWLWSHSGSGTSFYYFKRYPAYGEDWNRVESLLFNFLRVGSIVPIDIQAIYNPVLTSAFINQWKITLSRRQNDAQLFFQERNFHKNAAKQFVIEEYFKLCQNDDLPWNTRDKDYQLVPIIPSVHGTDRLLAEKIAETGFAALSKLDAGYFGKGIYFTQLLHYTLPYVVATRTPAVIISYLNMGNVYAVTESHKGERSLMGSALKAGYQSHFVLTTANGDVYDQKGDAQQKICNELVVDQESQILPAFILQFDDASCIREFSGWAREIPSLKDAIAFNGNATPTEASPQSLITNRLYRDTESEERKEQLIKGNLGYGITEEDENYYLAV